MIAADLQQVAEWTAGRLSPAAARVAFRGVSTDTRTLEPGNLFVALRGPNFDGHRFVGEALAGGAAAALVETEPAEAGANVVVADTHAALAALGRAWRAGFRAPVIALTGSNGKTTVKECLAAILRQRGPALATRGNLNNAIGVPLTLCELAANQRAAVFELGANHAGEIDHLARLVQPEVGLVINAGAAHLEGFGSIAGVAEAKGELFAALPAHATAVINADAPWAGRWHALAGERRRVTFGRAPMADVRIVAEAPLVLAIAGERRTIQLPLPGEHNRTNAAAAAAAAHAAGIDAATIAAGLAAVTPVAGRLRRRPGVNDGLLLDDSYNANPGSFAAAFDVLAEIDARRWAVVGEMAELGEATESAHRELGEQARAAGVERLWALGPNAAAICAAFGDGATVVDDLDGLAATLCTALSGDTALLVKGSRSNRLERLTAALATDAEARGDVV
jgi:UDP-N-acetylmuramoyl-tripeptide--D-alanyl-D-alanine ligase